MTFLEVKDLNVHFPIRGGILNRKIDAVRAVDGVSFQIEAGKTYGLVGESGSGKTTTGRAIIGLNDITSGQVLFQGNDLNDKANKKLDFRKDIQMIFQDPYSSLNPKKRVLDIVAEPLRNYEKMTKREELLEVAGLLEKVGLSEESIYKYPHQ
ncbi:ATP-binding cassette domain-containing protein, partial [Amphibacillus indicireducens]|uniref:ATP-binding cassette domain-containing protein n=1 Tax=Amphibacillus indicireducens TaxID=1076330 RepID=UPI0031EB41F3